MKKIKQMTQDEKMNGKERSILQEKLTKLAIQIGYIGMSNTFFNSNIVNIK